TFTIAKALDEDGNEIVPEVEYLDEIVSPIQMSIHPKTGQIRRRTWSVTVSLTEWRRQLLWIDILQVLVL
ncbi:hypothetical protein V5O48_012557, partial [Marasmius crinis-equi]